jgi:hypothetical protein
VVNLEINKNKTHPRQALVIGFSPEFLIVDSGKFQSEKMQNLSTIAALHFDRNK